MEVPLPEKVAYKTASAVAPIETVQTSSGDLNNASSTGSVRIVDPVAYITATQDPSGALYLAVQVALRDVVAAVTVEQLLADRVAIREALKDAVPSLANLGFAIERLELKDIVLPSELKRAQAEVLLARAEGQASLERARSETAALRSLANAARLAADNPALLQLRLLQQLGESTGHTVVLGTPPLATPLR